MTGEWADEVFAAGVTRQPQLLTLPKLASQ
jgi:hypothetical protein